MQVEVTLDDGTVVKRDLNQELNISSALLDDEIQAFPGQLCWWSLLAAQARAEREINEKTTKALEADLSLELRNPLHIKTLQDEGYRITEDLITSRIRSSESWRTLNKEWSQARAKELKLDAIVRSFEAKHDLIIQKNADRRQEKRLDEFNK